MAKNQNREFEKAEIRSTQLHEFLQKLASTAKTSNIDHYFRSGELSSIKLIMDLGEHFLRITMGFDRDEFIPCVTSPDFPNYVPQSEDYYPWALFLSETKNQDLDQIFHQRAINYLHSDSAGKKNFAMILNFREIGIYDLKQQVAKYSFSLLDLHEALTNGSEKQESIKALQAWQAILADFGPESSREKKKQRRADVVKYNEPKDDRLGFVKRFGHMPDFQKPIGWDGKGFRETFKTKNLPFLITEDFKWEKATTQNSNRLIWGDNLSIMRALPSESIDLIYIDPPFFSGRNYNCIFGDNDEVRTFNDIWDGGIPTYLAWLNARLWEMKRLLKETGSIVVHLDWHAAHYVKVEMDKIFGYENFKNEMIWHYQTYQGQVKSYFPRKHDNIFVYAKNPAAAKFKLQYWDNCEDTINFNRWKQFIVNKNEIRGGNYPATDSRFMAYYNRWVKENGRKPNKNDIILKLTGNVIDSLLDIKAVDPKSSERIGYPTQKPEELLKVIVEAYTLPGDTVADFFSGGGTTVATAEKLGRKWIGCDVSRIAISVARDRIQSIYKNDVGIEKLRKTPELGFIVQNHGAYDKSVVRQLDDKRYKEFILQCFEATPEVQGDYIHGYKMDKAVHIAPAKGKASVDLIEEFHVELSQRKIHSGVIVAWSWDKEAEEYIDELRRGDHGPEIQLIQVKLVDIDSHEFKEDNIRFLNKPAAVVRHKHVRGLGFIFDGTASQGRNETEIHYYQWDFNYKNRFSPMTRPAFGQVEDADSSRASDNRKVAYEFPEDGIYKVALRIVDKAGAEDINVIEIDTRAARKKKAA
jgi:DNA modification methylase